MGVSTKQVMDIKTSKGVGNSSNEQLRNWTEGGWQQAQKEGNYDRSRERLNFEVVCGGVIRAVNKGYTLADRMADNLQARGIKDPNEGLEQPRFRTIVNFIFGGSRDRMRELAFGDQEVNFDNKGENWSVERRPEIEEWAKDIYGFVANKWGEQNIVSFIVHLDEKNPHVHCSLMPLDKDNKFAFKRLFAGGNIIEFKQRSLELHNELAKVNEKWGLSRGSNIAETGSRHRSTEEYRRWLNTECTSLEEQIANQQHALSDLRVEIAIAEKKQKSFRTMIANLHKEKEDLLKRLSDLKEQMQHGESDKNELAKQIKVLSEKLEKTDAKLADKEHKLSDTEQQLATLHADMKEISESAADMAEKARTSHLEWAHNMAYHMNTEILENVVKEFMSRMRALTPEQRCLFDGTLLEELASHGNRVITTGMLLMCDTIDSATDFAESNGGGGGGSTDGWGRDPDEDDREWARRCLVQAFKMMKPASGKKRRV